LFTYIFYQFKVILSCIIKRLPKNLKNFANEMHTNDMYVLIKGKLTIFLITNIALKNINKRLH